MKHHIFKFFSSLGYIVQYGCVVHCTFEYLGDFVLCSGPSMEPTIYSDDILFTEHVSSLTYSVKKGDIIIAKCPTNPKQQICKRVIALQGEKVKTGFASYEIVPIGHVWLQGDNKSNSTDSRNYGAVPLGLIRSKAVCKIWPPNRMAMLTNG
ncbi:mitochondrial inner membrane protease subunit 1 [Anthonomus grandis grandis]|uniref:mitochondrial inner membrane protease subunit 1 n=1 Tax=Anthonomus grandis grandis TaxID=2921223 RepID=UPI0021655A75|nr:mitochondrial inner membrane protease subunit 1 [Anthonomus grandis grandis]